MRGSLSGQHLIRRHLFLMIAPASPFPFSFRLERTRGSLYLEGLEAVMPPGYSAGRWKRAGVSQYLAGGLLHKNVTEAVQKA